MENTIKKPDFIFWRQNWWTLGYALTVVILLSNAEMHTLLKLFLGVFAFMMLLTFVKGYNSLSLKKLVASFKPESQEFKMFNVLYHNLLYQFTWLSVFTVSLTLWLIVILVVRDLS